MVLFWAKENAVKPLLWSWCPRVRLQCTSQRLRGQETIGRDPTKGKPAERWGCEDAEQQLFRLCVTSVQLDALGLVVKSFGDDSGEYKFPYSFLLTDLQF